MIASGKHILIVAFLFLSLQAIGQNVIPEKINGLSLVSERYVLDSIHLKPMFSVNANYASVIPFCFMPTLDSGMVYYDNAQQWVGEKIEGARTAIRVLKNGGIGVMVKPQIWVSHGEFTGFIKMNTEENWQLFEEQYGAYILEFAKLAEEEGAEMFCIGTEMKEVVANRPELFPNLIKKVREVYSGKLTYAENWDCIDKVLFWDQLDFIGVDAYFPISKKKKPKMKDLRTGWKKWTPLLDSLSSQFDRKILFTEFGYRSIRKCAEEPWSYDRSKMDAQSQEAQARALRALFETLWDKEYFAGGFLWKWYPKHAKAGGARDTMFTVQNKKAEAVVRKAYLLY